MELSTGGNSTMNSNQSVEILPPRRSAVTPLTVLLSLIIVFFCAVLIFVYAATRRANPVMLDQEGHPLDQSTRQAK
jgi:hypothetical protein